MNKKRILSSLSISLVVEIINKLCPIFILHIAIVRLGAEAFGYSQFSITFIEAAIPFVVFGYTIITSQDLERLRDTPQDIGAMLGSLFALRLIHAFIVFLGIIVFCLIHPAYQTYLQLFSLLGILLFITAFDVTPLLLAKQKIHILNFLLGMTKIMSLIAIYYFVQSPEDADLYAILTLSVNAVVGLCGTIYGLRILPLKKPRWDMMRDLFGRGSRFATITIGIILIERYDIFLAEYFYGTVGAAQYAGPARLAHSLHSIIAAGGLIFVSELISVKDSIKFTKHVQLAMLGASLFLFPICLGTWWVDEGLITLIFGDEYRLVARHLSILILAASLQSMTTILGFQVLSLKEEISAFTTSLIVGLIVGIVAAFILSDSFRLLGIAYSSLLAKAATASIVGYFAIKHVGYSPFKIMVKPFLAATTMATFLYLGNLSHGLHNLLLGGCIYLLTLIFLYRKEMQRIDR